MKIIIFAILTITLHGSAIANAITSGTYYIIAETLNVRTAANPKAKIAKKLTKNSKIEVYEIKNGWARVTKYLELNTTKKTALWVSARYLSSTSVDNAKCKVLDLDISISYSGGCKNGLAHGEGLAKGKDVYRGSFFAGVPHGFGVYEWGGNTKWTGDRFEGKWTNGERMTGYGEYSSKNKLENGILENGRYVYRRIINNGKLTHLCNSKTDCEKVSTEQSISKKQLKKMLQTKLLEMFELDDSSIPSKSKEALGACLSGVFLGSALNDDKSTYTEQDLNKLMIDLSINMLALSIDKEELLNRVKNCTERAVEKGFRQVDFNELLLSMDDYKYHNIMVSGNGVYLMNQFLLRKNNTNANIIMVNISSLEKKDRAEVLEKCSNPIQGCKVTVYGQIEEQDSENILNAKMLRW